MPPRSTPTLRQRRLGTELRRMREQAGLGGSQLGRIVGMSPAQVTQMESGRIGISVDRLHTIAAACNCANRPLIEALAEVIGERSKGWWETYKEVLTTDFLEVAEVESHARAISICTTTYIPGLLQTGTYASAVFTRVYPPLSRADIDVRTAFRVQRQQVVRSGKTPLTTFIHEAALRMQFGGPKVLAEQLGALVDDSAQSGISVRVVPFAVDTFPGAGENLTFAEGPVPELDTVQMDVSQGTLFFDSPADLAKQRAIFNRTETSALSEDGSRDFIRSIKKEVEGRYA
ncbi:helix-turn-helix domain-containing protein [Streptomyces sp. BE303]|uniref:helix-turn-helix domain-containing protein n=1 Tax=Streptomyces sp. BE303 TaxID=3002528 RepID=UPI002E766BCC|nr:helix-turn-helix transcriptional regulator [Streptomyces sp. BE303]MED7950282.1 helix-turn-helix transcriptional regulator [Streptomyces sp. BE303]